MSNMSSGAPVFRAQVLGTASVHIQFNADLEKKSS
jgi:hypothetical protein